MSYSESWYIWNPIGYINVNINTNVNINNNNITFVTLILHTFRRILKKMFFDYSDFNARLTLLKEYAIFENRVLIE